MIFKTAFSVMTLLVGQQKGGMACKNPKCWCWWWSDQSFTHLEISNDFHCDLSHLLLLQRSRLSWQPGTGLRTLAWKWPLNSSSLSLSVLTAILQVNLGQPVFTEAKDDGSDGDNCSCKLCKAPVKSSPPTFSFLQAGCPSCRPTNSVKALKGN